MLLSKKFKKKFNLRKVLKPISHLGLSKQTFSNLYNLFFHLALYHFSKLFRGKVDNNLIVLGGNYGKIFAGNTKYLYLYLKKNTNYKLVWITKSDKLLKELKEIGMNVLPRYSLETIRTLRRARAVFVTHGYVDTLAIKYSPKTVFVQTWHGGDIKIVGINTIPYFKNIIYSNLTRFLGLKLRFHQLFDYMVSPSKAEKPIKILVDSFKFPKKRILPVGYPRNDIFFSKDKTLKEKLRQKYNISDNYERIVLYAPTYRRNFVAKFPLSDEEIFRLNQLMKETKTLFLMKAHLKILNINFKEYENIQIVNRESDTQEILYIADILISDYSSITLDYLLLNRPVLLFPYDYDNYIKERGINYDHLKDIAPGPLLYTGKQLIEALRNISKIAKEYKSKREELRDYFNAYNDGNSSRRLLKFLKLI